MGIDLGTWRARIGLNYYHMCRPLQTRWRSSGGRLYHPGVASWGVGEVMTDTPLVLKGCMTVVALSLILQYVVHSWSKLRGRGGCGKVYCRWQGFTSQVKGILGDGGTLLLRTIVVVIPLLLVIAGDVETNPGPEEPTLKALLNELHSVRANWYNIGLELGIPYTELNCFRTMYSDPSGSLREVLIHWLDTAVDSPPSWEAVVRALRSPLVNKMNVAVQLELKYCPPMREDSNHSIKVEEDEEVNDQTTASSQFKDKIERSQKLPFGCGCGKSCTFFSFIEKGCPTPIPSASSFPYLDLSGLTHEQQQELQGKLRFESQSIMIRFQELVSATVNSLNRRKISPKKLMCHIMTLGAFRPVFKEPQVPVFCHCFRELKAAKTIYDIFLVLNDYFSFFNYQLIERIIKALGTRNDKAKLQRYKEDFNQYAMRRIFESLPEFGPVSDADHADVDVFVKLDSQYENYTVTQIEWFRNKLSDILLISSQGILRLCRVDKGCVQLMFQVPSFVQQEVFPLSREQEKALSAMGVIKVTCGEYQFKKGQFSQAGDKRDHPDDESGIGPSISTDTESEHEIVPHFSREHERALGVKCGEYQFGEDELSQAEVGDDFGVDLSKLFTDIRSVKDYREELDYKLKVQELVETASIHKSESDLELHHAAAMGQLKNVRFLVENKHCKPMETDHGGFTAFHVAALEGKVQVFKYFVIECNCHPACSGPLGLTPLHLASVQGHLDMVKYLIIEQQIDPECEDDHGGTPLHSACAGGSQAVVEFLTSKLIEFNPIPKIVSELKNKWDSTPLHTAAWNGHLKILKFFISDQNCNPMCRDAKQNTPLHLAALGGYIEIVKFLTVEIHCDPASRNAVTATALHLAAVKGYLNIVQFFISDLNCDPNLPGGHHGQSLLHCAATYGHLDIVKYLTDEQGCNPLACLDKNKCTPLHCAAAMGHMEIVKFLILQKRCDPMCPEIHQTTPLHIAASNGHTDIVKFLTLEMHCDPTRKTANNNTTIHAAVSNGHLDIVQFLISDLKCDPNITGQYDLPPLHYAAHFGHLHIIKYLIDEQGCNPSCLDKQRGTPLQGAAANGHMDIVKFLAVEKHCDPMLRNIYGNTALHSAVVLGHLEIVKFLIEELKCPPDIPGDGNMTPLQLARGVNRFDIAQYLQKHSVIPYIYTAIAMMKQLGLLK